MKIQKKELEDRFTVFGYASSLKELLDILKSVCMRLNLQHLSTTTKQYRQFRFTFFGLIVKALGLLDRLMFKSELLEQKQKQFHNIIMLLRTVKKELDTAYKKIKNNNIEQGRKRIIEAANKYDAVFRSITGAVLQ